MKRPGILALIVFLLLITAPVPVRANAAEQPKTVHIFFSAGCADCWPYMNDVLLPALKTSGVDFLSETHDFTAPEGRQRMSTMIDAIEMPRSIADSLYAFIPMPKGTLVVLGHVPGNLVQAALTSPNLPPKLILWQPKMHGDPTEYRLWGWTGEVQSFSIRIPMNDALKATA